MKLLKLGEKDPLGYNKITGHWVFVVRLELRRKAQFLASDHLTGLPKTIASSVVISRETVRIIITITALNSIYVRFFDIGGEYLNADTDDYVYFISGK